MILQDIWKRSRCRRHPLNLAFVGDATRDFVRPYGCRYGLLVGGAGFLNRFRVSLKNIPYKQWECQEASVTRQHVQRRNRLCSSSVVAMKSLSIDGWSCP